jgi:transcriptional regulator with XRE-family HTH domain
VTVGGTNNDATRAFRTAFRCMRKARGLSVQTISDRLAQHGHIASRSALSNLESGRMQSVTLDVSVGIADILGVPLVEMLAAVCEQCVGMPPPGFTCNACGTAGKEPT